VANFPRPGDARYPTVGKTIAVGVTLVVAAMLVDAWLHLGIWPWAVAAVVFVYLVVVNLWTVRHMRRRGF
jgi:hypothetical protein